MSGRTIWLASYPKSGSTWVRAVLAALDASAPLDLERLGGVPVAADRRTLERGLLVDSTVLTDDEIAVLRPASDEVVDAQRARVHLRKVHDALRRPDGSAAVSLRATKGAVYVARDPRAVAVSYAHHLGVPVAEVVALMATGQAAADSGFRRQLPQWLSSWSEHVRSWRGAPFPVHLVRYEDLHEAPETHFASVISFIGLDPRADELRRAIVASSFDALRRSEEARGFSERAPRSTAPFFRRGLVAGWRDELSDDDESRLLADHGELMRELGYLAD